MSNQIPTTIQAIVDQLGGARIFVMAFGQLLYEAAPSEAGIEARATFKVGVDRSKAVVVELLSTDTYTVRYVKCPTIKQILRGADPHPVVLNEMSDVYAEDLRPVVESMTGLFLKL